MTAREYADRLRDLVGSHISGGEDDLEELVQELLVLRERDVNDIVEVCLTARESLEHLQSLLNMYGDFHQQVAEWVAGGMTRGEFPKRPGHG